MKGKIKVLLSVTALVCLMSVTAFGGIFDIFKNKKNEPVSQEKVVNLALTWSSANLDPALYWNGCFSSYTAIGETLIKFDENMNLVPVIAESFEAVGTDTLVFNIRDNATFHSGRKVDAEAVKNSIQRTLEITDRDEMKFELDSIKADGQTLTIKTPGSNINVLNNLADSVFVVVDTVAAAEMGEEFKMKPVLTGAFKVVSYDPEKGLEAVKFDQHWSGDIGVDRISAKIIKDANTRTMALQSGEIDIATTLSYQDVNNFENDDEFVVQRGPNLKVFLFRLNVQKPYMQNLDFRKALYYAIDKETFATKIANGSDAYGPFGPNLAIGEDAKVPYQFNPAKAKELLDKIGFIDTNNDGIREYNGQNIVLKIVVAATRQSGVHLATAMQKQYGDVGIGVEIIQLENMSNWDKVGYDLMYERWTAAPSGDAQYFFDISFKSDGSSNIAKYSNPDFEALTDELRLETDTAKRQELAKLGSKMLVEDIPALFMFYPEGNLVVRKGIDGVVRYTSGTYIIDERIKKD